MEKSFVLFVTSKTQTAFRRQVENWQLRGSFLLKIKIERKKLDSFIFYGENNSKTF